ncbi:MULTISPECIES: IS66 family insertion sequence element accessory protein TnpA [unclassified Endozoicomonas]|uniref:IS66 family insertion sequence element accessory protein TnpA n=1 Tax=unclassified Endozoicomonas TaxID=2644528 RepID=UPI003BB76477
MKQLTKPFTRLNPEQWQQIIDQQIASGLSQKAFCQTQNISLATFTNWKRKLRDNDNTDSFDIAQASAPEWVEVPNGLTEPPASLNWQLELELPGGVILRMRR